MYETEAGLAAAWLYSRFDKSEGSLPQLGVQMLSVMKRLCATRVLLQWMALECFMKLNFELDSTQTNDARCHCAYTPGHRHPFPLVPYSFKGAAFDGTQSVSIVGQHNLLLPNEGKFDQWIFPSIHLQSKSPIWKQPSP